MTQISFIFFLDYKVLCSLDASQSMQPLRLSLRVFNALLVVTEFFPERSQDGSTCLWWWAAQADADAETGEIGHSQ